MARQLGAVLVCLLGCGDNLAPPPTDLVADLSTERALVLPASRVLAIALTGIDDHRFLVARATAQGEDFCEECLTADPTECAATCRRAVLEVTRHRTDGPSDTPQRFLEVFPATRDHVLGALQLVSLDEAHAGVAWLECDDAACGTGQPKRSCTARYTKVDLITGRPGTIATLYEGWYGDLQLAFDQRTRRLLAVLGKQAPSRVGVRAAIFNELGGMRLGSWRSYGGAGARAPAAAASRGGFVIAADDPAPSVAALEEPCADSCECSGPAPPSQITGGLFAFHPSPERAPERIAPGRDVSGTYGAREAIAAIDAGGRVIVASSQAKDGLAELFEPAIGGWLRRHVSRAPVPLWLGALGDSRRLAWIGSEPDAQAPDVERLTAGVALIGELEQRGELTALEPGRVLQAAPAGVYSAVTTAYVLRRVSIPGGAPPERFEILAVRADW
ncbi:MAG TPA: hypothetical protein VNO30_26000 [Kofleriaceae bacterium]|nr:hypothetical protein [Kofleriaceae bacterium]